MEGGWEAGEGEGRGEGTLPRGHVFLRPPSGETAENHGDKAYVVKPFRR